METLDLRDQIDRLISDGATESAFHKSRELWRREKSQASAGFLLGRLDAFRQGVTLTPYRLAILRSFTVEPLVPLLRAAAMASGIDLAVHAGDFNTYAQEILDSGSLLYSFQPDAVILAVQTRDLAPDLWHDYCDLSPAEEACAVSRVVTEYRQWIGAFRGRTSAHLIVHSLEAPAVPARGVLDAQRECSQIRAVQRINEELRRLVREFAGTHLLDYDALVARYGRALWHDERKWLAVRLPIAAAHLTHLVEEWLRYLHPLTGKVAKALVVDLDNTLWGGVAGEEGMAGIQLGGEYPGAAYQAVQRALLDLYRRGILLAICSKNNPEDAMEVIEKHPGMLLRPGHFSAVRINWNDKSQNLVEIAAELNIGVESLALLDDSPVEREQVRSQLPETMVIELPEDPMAFAGVLRDQPVFERLSLSAEDVQRGEYYAAQRERQELQKKSASREDFYRSLEQEAEIAPVTPLTLPRIAQLTQKTNQFNLTTKRYSEQQVSELAATPGWQVWSLRLRDRFADNGVVAVAILREHEEYCELDTFLLSCRVIGRTVETAFLSHLAERARTRGASRLQGWFFPTRKNAPAKDFYASHGFHMSERTEAGSLWILELPAAAVRCPPWIRITVQEGPSR